MLAEKLRLFKDFSGYFYITQFQLERKCYLHSFGFYTIMCKNQKESEGSVINLEEKYNFVL